LSDLADRLSELHPETCCIVYCTIGGRSQAAAQFLSGQGFKKVYHLKGGIKAWHDQTAVGLIETGMESLKGRESPQEIVVAAYGMEKGLQDFYRVLASRKSEDHEILELLEHLIHAEEGHQKQLFSLYRTFEPSINERIRFEETIVSKMMEGGMTTEEFLQKNEAVMQTPTAILDVAMMIEIQAFDLYSRYAAKHQNAATRKVLFALADEEKSHLQQLGQLRNELT